MPKCFFVGLSLNRSTRHDELAARHMVQGAQIVWCFIETSATVAKHTVIGPGGMGELYR